MGKNQTHKSMQMSKHSSRGGGEGDNADTRYAGHDASFHTAEWHAARLAALTMERPSWDDWKKTQDEAAARETAMEAAVAEAENEYKAALTKERGQRMGYVKEGGVKKKEGKEKKEKKEKRSRKRSSKDKKKKKSKDKKSSKDKKRSSKKKRRRSSSSDSSSGSGSSSDSDSSSSDRDYGGMGSPVRLSKFLNA